MRETITGPRSNLTPGQAAFRHWWAENHGDTKLANAPYNSPHRKAHRAARLWLAQFWWRIQYDSKARPEQKHFA